MRIIYIKSLTVSILCIFLVIPVLAQKTSKEEFNRFSVAFDDIHNAEQQNQQEIAAVAKAYGFTVEQLLEEDSLMKMMKNLFPNDPPSQDEKSKRVRVAMAGVQRLNKDLEEKRKKAIKTTGFSIDRYYSIRSELYKYASVLREVGDMNQKWQVEFPALVKESGLTGARFNELYKTYGNSTASLPENEETKAYSAVMDRVEEKTEELEVQMNKAFADNGFSQDRQREITAMVKADQMWSQRLRSMLKL